MSIETYGGQKTTREGLEGAETSGHINAKFNIIPERGRYLKSFGAGGDGALLGGLCPGFRGWLCFLGWRGFLLGLVPEKLNMNQY